MNWFGGSKKRVRRKASSGKRRNSSRRKGSAGKRRSSASRGTRFTFVKGQPRIAKPKPNGSGYYYTRKGSDGKLHNVSVKGRTYSKMEARRKLSSIKKRSR